MPQENKQQTGGGGGQVGAQQRTMQRLAGMKSQLGLWCGKNEASYIGSVTYPAKETPKSERRHSQEHVGKKIECCVNVVTR